MSAPTDSAHTPRFTVAGPLSFDGYIGAVFHASSALLRDPLVPGIGAPISHRTLWSVALAAVEPYCEGDRAAAAEAAADGLAPGWRDWSTPLQEQALAAGHALLEWLEQFDPARN